MKRLLQCVVPLVVCCMVTQTALAALSCPVASQCPMGMSARMPDCTMAHPRATSACPPCCCDPAIPAANPAWATQATPQVHSELTVVMPVVVASAIEPTATNPRPTPVLEGSLPRYVLYRVFRI